MDLTKPINFVSTSEKMVKILGVSAFIPIANLVFASTAAAQTPPDAGQVLREFQQQTADPGRPVQPVISVEQTQTDKVDDAVRFNVKSVQVTGSSIFPAAELEALVSDLVGKDRRLSDLHAAARRISAYYRDRGYILARGYIPPQEIKDGVVTIAVLEGQLGKKAVINESSLLDGRVSSYLGNIGEGDVIAAAPLNRALLLLADTPGMGGVKANLKPGDRVGTSDLTVHLTPGPLLAGEISADNHGNRFTGQYRLSGRLDVNNPTRLGDRLRLRATASDEALVYGRLSWDFPVGADGLRLGGAYTASRYELGRDFASLDAHGTANTASLYSAYPLLRSLTANVYAGLSLEDRRLRDRIDTLAIDIDKRASAGVMSLNGDFTDALGGGAATHWHLSGTVGNLSIDPPAQRAIDEATARTHGGYLKVTANLARLQTLTPSTSVYLTLSGQLASKNLDSSEKFALGGAYGVRAYPQGEAAGDEGWQAALELRRTLLPGIQGTLFYDAGAIKINHTPFAAGSNTRNIAGYGVGANAVLGGFNLRASLAWRASRGATSDVDRIPRLWVAGSLVF